MSPPPPPFTLHTQLREIRGNPKPAGGLQLIVCGDFFQLPPGEQLTSVSTSISSLDTGLETDRALKHCIFRLRTRNNFLFFLISILSPLSPPPPHYQLYILYYIIYNSPPPHCNSQCQNRGCLACRLSLVHEHWRLFMNLQLGLLPLPSPHFRPQNL